MNHLDYDSCPDEIRSLPPNQSSGLLKPLLRAGFGRAGLTFLSSALIILRNLKNHIVFTFALLPLTNYRRREAAKRLAVAIQCFFLVRVCNGANHTKLPVCRSLYFSKEPTQCVRFCWQAQRKHDWSLHAF